MNEIRFAKDNEIKEQKKIWKLCFKDADNYIDLFYSRRYNKDGTLLLLSDNKLSAMLTILPAKILTQDNRSFDSSILYAIATHPEYQNRGFASELIDYTGKHLRSQGRAFSLLVPATCQLFDYYRRLGYNEAFFIRELTLDHEKINSIHIDIQKQYKISITTAKEYNFVRNSQLRGRLFVAYTDEDIDYQKSLSEESGANIYVIENQGIYGCAAIERISTKKLLIKELLLPDALLAEALKEIARIFPAKEYFLRTPVFSAQALGGTVRPFAMIKKHQDVDWNITADTNGYMGLAFD